MTEPTQRADYGRSAGPPETMFDIIEMARDWRFSNEFLGSVLRHWVQRLDARPEEVGDRA